MGGLALNGCLLGDLLFFCLGGKGERIDVDSVMFRMGMRDLFLENFILSRVEDEFMCRSGERSWVRV